MSDDILFVERGSISIGIRRSEYKGKKFIDVRNYYYVGNELKPTPKGLSIPVENAEEVAQAILGLLDNKLVKKIDDQVIFIYYIVASSQPGQKCKVKESRVFADKGKAVAAAKKKPSETKTYGVWKYTGPKLSFYEGYCKFDTSLAYVDLTGPV